MAQTDPVALVNYLRRGAPRTRVGLRVAPLKQLGKEIEIFIKEGVQLVDVSQYYLEQLPQGAQFARLASRKIIETLDSIASSPGQSDCVLINNFDLLLSGVKDQERQEIWKILFNGLPHRRRALIIILPDTAQQLLPNEDLMARWRQEMRIVW